MASLVPQLPLQIMRSLFGLLIVDADKVIPARGREISPIMRIVQGKDLVVGFSSVPKLFTCFGQELEQMPVGICGQHHSPHRLQLLGSRSPAQGIDWGIGVAFLIFDIGVYFCDFGVADEVVDADVPIAGPASHQGILVREFRKHDFAFLLYGGLQGQLLL